MRILLLFAAALLSGAVLFLTYTFLSGTLSSLLYAIFSSAIEILLLFALFHFIYLYLRKPRQ